MFRLRAFLFPGVRSTMSNHRGFTLVEIMISCTISIFIIIIFVTLLSSTRSSWFTSQVQSDLYLNGRKAVQAIYRELVEASSGSCAVFPDPLVAPVIDPISGQFRRGLWFASGRGDPGVAGEDGSLTNDYMHIDANYKATWRSVVVIFPYVTPEGQMQLRRYVDYDDVDYSVPGVFPLTLLTLTPGNIIFQTFGGATITFDRTAGTVLANYLASEDANNNNVLDANENDAMASLPPDNADGRLNLGMNLTPGQGTFNITLFLSRQVNAMNQAGRFLVSTVRQTVKLRQP